VRHGSPPGTQGSRSRRRDTGDPASPGA
jgi:hypothetical protein